MEQKIWGIRTGHNREIAAKIISYLQAQPVGIAGSSEGWGRGWSENSNEMDTLLELIYQSYTEFNSVETPEFKAIVNPLDRTLRALVDTDEEADGYMNIVFELCTAYERQSYIEGLKAEARLMVELMDA